MKMETFNKTTMKRFFNISFILSVLVASLSSCQEEVNPTIPNETEDYVYTFALSNVETKAYLDENVARWESGDKLGVYTDGVNGKTYNRYANIDTDKSPVEFKINCSKALAVNDKVYCYYPYNAANSNGDAQNPISVSLSIPNAQSGKMTAMPMVAVPYSMETSAAANTNNPIADINLMNLGGVFQFRVFSTNEAYRTETVKSVKFTADKAIAGSFVFNITQIADLSISGYSDTEIIVKQDAKVGASKDEDAAGIVNMVVAPGSYTGTIEVTTNAATYTYTISSAKAVERAHIKPLNVDLGKAGVREIVPSNDYILVEEDGAFIDGGKYVFAIKDGANGKYYFISNAGSSNTLVEGVCSVSDNIITDPSTDYVFTATEDGVGFKFQNSGSNYIYCNGSNTTLNTNSASEEAIWVPSFLTSSKCYKISLGSTSGRYIGAASTTKVAGYANSNFMDQIAVKAGVAQYSGAISVFKLGGKTVVENPKIDNGLVEGLSAREDVYEYSVSVNNIDSDAELTIEPDGVVVFHAEIQEGAPHTIIYYLNNNLSSETAEGYINVALKNNPTVKATITVKQNAAKWDVTNNNIELKAANGSSKTFTVHSDFDWVIDTESLTGYSVSPSVFEYSNSDSQDVTVTATSANASVDDIELGSFKIVRTEDDAEIEISVKQLNAKLATPEITNISKDTDAMTATITWKKLGNASSYSYYLTDAMGQTVENSTGNIENPDAATQSATVSIPSKDVNYLFHVKAVGDGENYFDSDYAVSDDICIETPVVGGKEYTATITSSILVINDSNQSSTYLKYAGNQTVVAKAADNSEMPMTFSISNVMPGTGGNTGKLQFRASEGTISGDGWGTIKSITADSALTVSYSGGSFTVKKTTKNAGYYDSIVIVFEK